MSHAVTIQRYETADNTMIEKCGHGYKILTGKLTFTTYATGGVSVDLSQDMPTRVHFFTTDQKGGYTTSYDYTNRKLLIYEAGADGAPLDQVAAGEDLSTTMDDTRYFAIGK
jgi:hypothetical protein